MHDWTLVSFNVEWAEAILKITFKNEKSEKAYLVAENFSSLIIPKREKWGESKSVNKVEGPIALSNGSIYLFIEMQSGDKIEIEAERIIVP